VPDYGLLDEMGDDLANMGEGAEPVEESEADSMLRSAVPGVEIDPALFWAAIDAYLAK
jgi:hypothetical protein